MPQSGDLGCYVYRSIFAMRDPAGSCLLVSIGRLNNLNKTSHDASSKHFARVMLETLQPACLLIVHMLV